MGAAAFFWEGSRNTWVRLLLQCAAVLWNTPCHDGGIECGVSRTLSSYTSGSTGKLLPGTLSNMETGRHCLNYDSSSMFCPGSWIPVLTGSNLNLSEKNP